MGSEQARRLRKCPAICLILVGGNLLIAALALYLPVDPHRYVARPNPAKNHKEAEQRIQAIQAQEASHLNPLCQTEFLSNGTKAERAIVLVHGYTNCPQQFTELGRLFYQKDYNVLITPLPYNGLADRMTEAQARITAGQLATYGDKVVDIAQGLGDRVTIMGFSAGGVVTGWAAQNRKDVHLAVLISPSFGYAQVPPEFTLQTMRIFSILPNAFIWWDSTLKEEIGPPYAYPRISTHAVTQILQLGFGLQSQARISRPRAKSIQIVTNASDNVVNLHLIEQVVELWRGKAASQVHTYQFPAELNVGHDLIDPNQADQRTDVVYPKLLELATQ